MLSGMCLILFVYIDHSFIQHSSKIRDIFAHVLMFILGQCAVQLIFARLQPCQTCYDNFAEIN